MAFEVVIGNKVAFQRSIELDSISADFHGLEKRRRCGGGSCDLPKGGGIEGSGPVVCLEERWRCIDTVACQKRKNPLASGRWCETYVFVHVWSRKAKSPWEQVLTVGWLWREVTHSMFVQFSWTVCFIAASSASAENAPVGDAGKIDIRFGVKACSAIFLYARMHSSTVMPSLPSIVAMILGRLSMIIIQTH